MTAQFYVDINKGVKMFNYQEGFLAARQLGEARGGEEVPEHRGDDQEEGASPADRGRQVQGGEEDLQWGFWTTQVGYTKCTARRAVIISLGYKYSTFNFR